MFEGDSVAGPIPTLFGEDIIASKSAISANPERAFSDFQRLVRAFFMPETLQPEEAPNFVKKPRSVPFLFFPLFLLDRKTAKAAQESPENAKIPGNHSPQDS